MDYFVIRHDSIKRDPATEGAVTPDERLRLQPAAFWQQFTPEETLAFCVRRGLYCVPTLELVSWLSDAIGTQKTIEIGAGRGELAESLQIIATDNKMQNRPEIRAYYAAVQQPTIQYGPKVRPMDGETAVKRLKPKVVIGAWVTHKFRADESWREGNELGVREEKIVERADYIFIGNQQVHRHKPILELPHERYEFPWLVSRAVNGSPNFIGVWKKGAHRG